MNLDVKNLGFGNANWIACCCSSDFTKIAMLETSTGNKSIWIGNNGTNTSYPSNWTQTASANIPAQTGANYWRAITCSNDFTKIIAVREGGNIYFSHDSGATWYASNAPVKGWYGVAGSADLSVAYAVNPEAVTGNMYKSTDYGATWTKLFNTGEILQVSFVCCSSDGTKVAVTYNSSFGSNSVGNGVSISTNSGGGWSSRLLQHNGINQFFRAICCTPDFTKLAAITNSDNSTSKLWMSTNSGDTWTNKEANIYAGVGLDTTAISASVDFTKIVICVYRTLAYTQGGVYYSVDSGESFRLAPIAYGTWHATCFSKTSYEFMVLKAVGIGVNSAYIGKFLDGATTVTNDICKINMTTPNFSSWISAAPLPSGPRLLIRTSNSSHLPVSCSTYASNADMNTILDRYTNAAFLPTVGSDHKVYFYWKNNSYNSNIQTYPIIKYQAYLSPGANLFTGQHKTLPDDPTIKENLLQNIGLIMSSNDSGYTSGNSGKHAIYINEALPNCSLSVTDEDPCVFGIITNNANGGSDNTDDTNTDFCTSLNDSVRVNSLGEGAMWVSNINGHIQNGDWVTSSRIPGVGKKQTEIRRCNYTVAKATMSCNFELGSDKYKTKMVSFESNEYIMAFISVTYHCG